MRWHKQDDHQKLQIPVLVEHAHFTKGVSLTGSPSNNAPNMKASMISRSGNKDKDIVSKGVEVVRYFCL